METLSREELFSLFKKDVHPQISMTLAAPSIHGLAVYENPEGRRRAVPISNKMPPSTDDGFTLVGMYRKPAIESTMTRTMAALDYLNSHPDATPYAVAKQFGISASAIYRARKRRAGKIICPCCGQVVREGFVIEH